jgi:uncharacterized phage infection (PIP) family protein YhgE
MLIFSALLRIYSFQKLFFMSDVNQTMAEKANALKDQAAEKLGELKDKAEELAGSLREKAGQAWDQVNSDETKEKINHLKDQAEEKLHEAGDKLSELADKAKGAWEKLTHHEDHQEPTEKKS